MGSLPMIERLESERYQVSGGGSINLTRIRSPCLNNCFGRAGRERREGPEAARGTVNVSEIRINICGRSRPSGWPCSFLLSSLSFSQYLWHLSLPFLPNYFWRSCSAGGREHLPSLRRMKCAMRISLISSTRHRRRATPLALASGRESI